MLFVKLILIIYTGVVYLNKETSYLERYRCDPKNNHKKLSRRKQKSYTKNPQSKERRVVKAQEISKRGRT